MKIIIIVFTLILNSLLTGCNEDAENGSSGKMDDAKDVDYWVAPMDANYRRDEAGKSPMGMDLVPVYKVKKAEKKIEKVEADIVREETIKAIDKVKEELEKEK